MKQSNDIRVRTSGTYEDLYRDLRPFCGEAHSLFFLCVCLGYREARKAAEGKRADRFWSSTITPDEWAVYYALAADQSHFDYDLLGDDKKVIALAEGYADGGMQILIEELLSNYFVKPGELRLDSRAAKELSWELLKFIPDKLE
jgi:hypothetical protein